MKATTAAAATIEKISASNDAELTEALGKAPY